MTTPSHTPVLLSEVLNLLDVSPGQTILDVTLGLGGHAQKFAEKIGKEGTLLGVDADAENIALAQKSLANQSADIRYYHSNFADLRNLSLPMCDRIFADLGVSSPHFDDPDRGFSFRTDAALDLRYDRTQGWSAAEWISNSSAQEIIQVLRMYGELPQARKIGEAVFAALPQTTFALRDTVESVVGFRIKKVLPQVFQAFRIAVNRELEALEALLNFGPTILTSGGILAIMSYHSLEDRMVKRKFRELTTPEKDSYTGGISKEAPFILLTKKPIRPSEEEIASNPRSRSALLRAVSKAL